MTQSAQHNSHAENPVAHDEEQDTLKAIMPLIPVVLPVVGGLMMFLLAFIAVFMG